jgi:hypothetical protein
MINPKPKGLEIEVRIQTSSAGSAPRRGAFRSLVCDTWRILEVAGQHFFGDISPARICNILPELGDYTWYLHMINMRNFVFNMI